MAYGTKKDWDKDKVTGTDVEIALREALPLYKKWVVLQNNAEDVKAIDLRVTMHTDGKDITILMDSKWCGTPAPEVKLSGVTVADLAPERHLTLDRKDIIKPNHGDAFIFVQKYNIQGELYRGIYVISYVATKAIMDNIPKRSYTIRATNCPLDKLAKVAISTDECKQITFEGMTPEETFDVVYTCIPQKENKCVHCGHSNP